jgi:hypothetical protein
MAKIKITKGQTTQWPKEKITKGQTTQFFLLALVLFVLLS